MSKMKEMVEFLEAKIDRLNNGGSSLAGDMMAHEKGYYELLKKARSLLNEEGLGKTGVEDELKARATALKHMYKPELAFAINDMLDGAIDILSRHAKHE